MDLRKLKKLSLLLSIICLTSVGCSKPTASFEGTDPYNRKLLVSNQILWVEIADTEEKRRRGLSDRNFMAEDEGMLFYFEAKNPEPVFWMKDTKFNLDLIWIKRNKIVSITQNVPAQKPGTPDKDLPRYSAPSLVDAVLEVNAGFAEKNGIKVGDEVRLIEQD